MSRDRALEAYFEEAASWERDRVAQARRTVRLLAWSGALGWGSAIAGGVALVALLPLKEVQPYLIRVDSTSGVVDVVPTYAGGAPLPETVTRYLVTHYVQVCERFNFATAEADYEECAAFHTPQRNQAWAAKWARSNPESPLNVYRDGTTLRAQVKSVSFLTRADGVQDLAQVRYAVERRTGEGSAPQLADYVATLRYAYVEPATDPRARRWNPLGFRIVDFRPEPEVGAPLQVAAAPTETRAMNRAFAACAVWVALVPLAATAESLPPKGARDARVRVAEYHADEVYRLPAFVGYQVHLEFEPGEAFVGLGAGDVEGVSFVATGHHLFLKPKVSAVTTNLTVVTDRREYQFEYSASAHRPNPQLEEVIYSLRFTYPPSGAPVAPALEAAASARAHNLQYGYCGPRSLQPTRAWDDGVQTYLTFAPRSDLPAVFVLNPDGTESLVNWSVEADQVRVHRVAQRLILRRGRQVGCLVNRAFAGGGTRLESGTVAPDVVRRTREVTP